MEPTLNSTYTPSGNASTPDIINFASGSIKAVGQEPLEVTREELKAIIGGELIYEAAAILAMRHGLLRIKEVSA